MEMNIKSLVASALLIAVAVSAAARPAIRGTVLKTQPDGSTVEVTLHGDEFHHWMTASDGQVVARAKDGFIRPVSQTVKASSGAMRRAAAMRESREKYNSIHRAPSSSGSHTLVILIEFSDVKFVESNPTEAFNDLLNKKGYNANGATGSAFDYFYDNSGGRFGNVFDVVGPVTLSHEMAYYGGNDENYQDIQPFLALIHACELLDDDVDFSKYDQNHDGEVDNVFFFYAGYNEAEGGPDDSIWPHAWDVYSALYFSDLKNVNITFDGVDLGSYACSSEFYGSKGENLTGIGAFCHEYAHTLGLPDFYDTDYEENGEAMDMLWFSLMASGSDNDDSKCPPYLNTIEKNLLGWMDMPEYLSEPGSYTLGPVQNNEAWLLHTDKENEYFVLECRTDQKWDAGLEDTGLLVYHVDKSTNKVGGKTAAYKWENWQSYNDLNAYAKHPLCCVVPSNPDYDYYADDFLFPGYVGATAFDDTTKPAATGWSGQATGHYLKDIAYSSRKVTFTYSHSTMDALGKKGFNAIDNPGEGQYKAGGTLSLALRESSNPPQSVKWYYDGTHRSGGTTVSLRKGNHIITAELTFEDGSKEVLELEIHVK